MAERRKTRAERHAGKSSSPNSRRKSEKRKTGKQKTRNEKGGKRLVSGEDPHAWKGLEDPLHPAGERRAGPARLPAGRLEARIARVGGYLHLLLGANENFIGWSLCHDMPLASAQSAGSA